MTISNNLSETDIHDPVIQLDDEQELTFFDEDEDTTEFKGNWKVLIVDDDAEIHRVSMMVLSDFKYKNKGLEFINAYSAEEARMLIQEHTDIVLILLDVVMEEDDAGLQLVSFIRDELNNSSVRIILRTGQPGRAPEKKVIIDYDINDYKEKTELTASKLFTATISSIRSYEHIQMIESQKNVLTEWNKELEKTVQERTASLRKSERQFAETYIEKSILEERNRIVSEIHDTVGHTLTSILVQIEAGKRLVAKNPEQTVKKLELSQAQIRNGLEEIRKSLKMLREGTQLENFIPSIETFIHEAIQNTGIDIKYELNPISLTPAQKFVLYRALQEGITNGIRHGKCTSFEFSLLSRNKEIYFRLLDNGIGCSDFKPGMGITGMKERVERLNGMFQFTSFPSRGCEIEITLPLEMVTL